MKFFFILFVSSIVGMFSGIYENSLNTIIAFGFLSISSSIIMTSIGKEEVLKNLNETIIKLLKK